MIPGNQDYRSLANSVKNLLPMQMDLMNSVKNWKYKDFVDNQFVIAGSPATVRDQLKEAVKNLRVGNLMVLLHIGSMPHELTLRNIDLFSREVLPHFRNVWDDYLRRVSAYSLPERARFRQIHEGHGTFMQPEERRFDGTLPPQEVHAHIRANLATVRLEESL